MTLGVPSCYSPELPLLFGFCESTFASHPTSYNILSFCACVARFIANHTSANASEYTTASTEAITVTAEVSPIPIPDTPPTTQPTTSTVANIRVLDVSTLLGA